MSEFSSKLSKGGRRKSSSRSNETPSSSGTQCMSKDKIPSASNSRISSPEQLPEVKCAENFVLETDKGRDCTTVSKRRRRVSSKQDEKLDDHVVNFADISCNRGCRKSSQKSDGDDCTNENVVTVAKNDGHLQSDDESDAEDNIEEVKEFL